jgi:3-hydroxyacyl-CoA dehydrogenase
MGKPDHQVVTFFRVEDVLELVIDQPPVNALGQGLRRALWQGLDRAAADPEVRAVLIRAEGRSFPVGADIAEFDRPAQAPDLSALCCHLESLDKPVVVAIHGMALGGGLELAMAAHLRVALADARLGLPEVGLGILPGAGGTQRLPRLIGAEQALRMAMTGRPVPAAEALAMGLLDHVVETGLRDAALTLARQIAGQPPRRTRDRAEGLRNAQTYQRAIAAARNGLRPNDQPAPARIVDCIEAAQLLPFDQGLAFERAAFDDLVATPQAAALRHAFFAERAAARFAEAATPPGPVTRIGIAGAAGAEHALPLLQAGCSVLLVEPQKSILVAALEKIAAEQQALVTAGRLSEVARDADWARLKPAMDMTTLAGVDVVLLAHPDHLDPAVLATAPGTPLLHLGRGRAPAGSRAADVLGFSVAQRLVELIVAPQSHARAVATAAVLARRLGRGVLRAAAPGGIAARVMLAGRAAAAHLVDHGLPAADVAGALSALGLSGLLPTPAEGSRPASAALAAEIQHRCLSAMAVEGARLLARGIAARPSDVDFALVMGAGFPRHLGGPMFWADQRGMLILRRDLALWAAEAPAIWGMPPLMDQLLAKGDKFVTLNR